MSEDFFCSINTFMVSFGPPSFSPSGFMLLKSFSVCSSFIPKELSTGKLCLWEASAKTQAFLVQLMESLFSPDWGML